MPGVVRAVLPCARGGHVPEGNPPLSQTEVISLTTPHPPPGPSAATGMKGTQPCRLPGESALPLCRLSVIWVAAVNRMRPLYLPEKYLFVWTVLSV